MNQTPPEERQPSIAHDYGCTFDPCECRPTVTGLWRMVECRHGVIDVLLREHQEHPEWAACVGYELVLVEPDYEAAQRMYERHVDAAVFDMVLSKTGGKAIVDAALGADDE